MANLVRLNLELDPGQSRRDLDRRNGKGCVMKQDVELWICPECGSEVEVGARGCPRCLEVERRRRRVAVAGKVTRPWEQDGTHDGWDLPDEDFDYHRFIAREFGREPHRRLGVAWYWWATALGLVALLTWAVIAR
jgi:hypothetical protein